MKNKALEGKGLEKREKEINPQERAEYGARLGQFGILCNFILFVIKLSAGAAASSVSVAADAVNNLSDAASSIISLLGFKMAKKPADKEHPFGHGRYEYIAGLTVSVMIIVIGVELLKTGIEKIVTPHKITFSPMLAGVLIASVIIKAVMAGVNYSAAKKIESKTLLAAAKDSRNDVLTTLAILLSCIISRYSGFEPDGWAGVVVAVFILISGAGLIKETLDPVIGSAPDMDMINGIRDRILSYPGVLGVHDIMVHDYGPARKFASVHVEMAAEDGSMKSHELIDRIERDFYDKDRLNMVIHFDPIQTALPIDEDIRRRIDGAAKAVSPMFSIHDLEIIPKGDKTLFVFDCSAEAEKVMSDEEIAEAVEKEVKKLDPAYECRITVDRSVAPVQK